MIDKVREENPSDNYSVFELCEALDVSRSGYYASKNRPPSSRSRQEETIATAIKEVHADRHTRCYGSPRMVDELASRGLSCSENRCARIMKKNDINARQKASFRPKTTISDPEAQPAPNLLRDTPEPTSPGEIYVSDITYVATREGWLYLAVVIDLYSRKVAGWKLADHMRATLATSALAAAITNVPPVPGAISHTDRGSQYSASTMRRHLALVGITPSMSAQGYCYDNAKAESFFATLKREAFPDDCCFQSKAEARRKIFDYLETFYNCRRRHSSLGNISPDEFLNRHFTNIKTTLN